jgi:Tfp pilus assembly protein PilN
MIEINLSSSTGKKGKGKGKSGGRGKSASSGSSFDLAASLRNAFAGVKDPFLLAAVGAVVVAVLAVGFMFTTQEARASELAETEARAVQDSARYAAVIRERRKAEAQRDSVLQQLDIIRSIDDQRYLWPHLMEELSKALPPYTWLTSVAQTSAVPTPAAVSDSAKAAGDTTAVVPALKLRIVGHTVDIQALTRFMRMLESSAFVQNVQLARTEGVLVGGHQVTEFHLDAEWQKPPQALLHTAPVSLSVR